MSRLAEIKARADAATEGPWQWRESEPTSLVHVTSPRKHPWNILKSPDWGPTLADAEFIAAAREDVPWLLTLVESLTAERDALAAAHARESEKVWKVEEVMDDIEGSDPTTWERLRDALAGSDADTTDTQPTDPGCGCSTNPARARYADGDPAGCYCTCSDDAREGCEHEPDEPQPTDLEVK